MGADFYRRSQFPSGFHLARHLESSWTSSGDSVTGQRKSVKIFGAIEMWKTRFHYQQDSGFNAETYLAFLESLARRYRQQGAILIHDNASYHKKPLVKSWIDANADWLKISEVLCQVENLIFSTGPTREITPPSQLSHRASHNAIFVAASSGELCLAKAAR
ncbi:MAG TPA: transposase [Candidatus Sulfotelmatobacter sp.]|nr:transposase [Candidatus Sulfotelmatobacter sp.]